MTTVERRTFLKAAAGGALMAGPFSGLVAGEALAAPSAAPHRRLRPVPDLRDGAVRLHLPEGFSYRSFHDTETPVVLDDGTVLPGRHDGMGAFRGPNGNVILVRNHEVNGPGAGVRPATTPYDPRPAAARRRSRSPARRGLQAYTSLNGTQMNCRGGRCPGAAGSRARRRSTARTWGRTSPAPPTWRSPSATASSSRSRSRGVADRRADHPAPAGSPTRRSSSTRATASST